MTADRSTERIGPPLTAGERETLRAFLDYQRATLAMKCDGLSDDDLRRQSMNGHADFLREAINGIVGA